MRPREQAQAASWSRIAMKIFAFIMAALAYFKVINVHEMSFWPREPVLPCRSIPPRTRRWCRQLVPRQDLTNAIALNSAQFNMSRVLGPTLGGFAMALSAWREISFLNGLSFLAVLVALTRIRYAEPAAPQEGRLWEKLKQGFVYVFRHSAMSSLFLLWRKAACWPFHISPLFLTCPRRPRQRRARPRRPDGLFRRGRIPRRHHHRVARASSPPRAVCGPCVCRILRRIIAFTFSRNFYLSGLLLSLLHDISVATIKLLLQHWLKTICATRDDLFQRRFSDCLQSAASSPARWPTSSALAIAGQSPWRWLEAWAYFWKGKG